jgi:hypothetical protein
LSYSLYDSKPRYEYHGLTTLDGRRKKWCRTCGKKRSCGPTQQCSDCETRGKLLLLIGGYPKGFPEPFSPQTLSGRRLRKIVSDLGLDSRVEYYDLWRRESEEYKGVIPVLTREYLLMVSAFKILIPLGRYTTKKLIEAGFESYLQPLPHPASRRKEDLVSLKNGLRRIAGI